MTPIKRIGNEPPSSLDTRIYTMRGQAVMLDSDLAEVYQVTTSQINQAVKRNMLRFPPAYSFQLEQNEWDALRSQIVILNAGRGRHRKYLPRVFTEPGAISLATVLNSDRAITASIFVVDSFVSFRRILWGNQELSRRVDELAAKVGDHDKTFAVVFEELKRLAVDMAPERPRERIGFRTNRERGITGKTRGK
jgi:hypothetical protein